ncbi:MAG: adenosylcobinamide amidohydrolase [Deltaproteobacteria bacterium]|nr:adenosylcobinamide amidohydrolase [Deltaproteobacteria bacterium]
MKYKGVPSDHQSLMVWLLCAILLLFVPATAFSFALVDSTGNTVNIDKPPARVVSLVPSITEIIFEIGAGDAVRAVTCHDAYPGEVFTRTNAGGFFSPNISAIEKENPDLIFYADLQRGVKERFGKGPFKLINLDTRSIADSYRNIRLLGKIFQKEKAAESLVSDIEEQLGTVKRKLAKLPAGEKKRVIRLMGRNRVMTPGDDSFQNELIRAAGGITPVLGKNGNVVEITQAEWMKFNPQVIYGCGGDRKTAETFLARPGWKDVDAVRNKRIFFFPCELTCRAAAHTGYFVSWLSSRIYADAYSKSEDQVLPEAVFRTRRLDIDLPYVRSAVILYSHIHDFLNKTLLLDFTKPLGVVSTLEGQRREIESVGNHYSPPPCWAIEHHSGLETARKRVLGVISRSPDTTALLFTGADMDHLAISKKAYRDMTVYALVTAGVKSNALRMSRDSGNYYEPGTINILILSNMALSARAMSRAIITATEAKTAVMQDLDIRSRETPGIHQATGTGTDNIIVVQGTGKPINLAGGHSKMGELIAAAVYDGVMEAIGGQNGLIPSRHIFRRLMERGIGVYELIASVPWEPDVSKADLSKALEETLLQPRYAAFLESSFAVSDDYEKGLISDLAPHELWCNAMAEKIAGRKIEKPRDLVAVKPISPVLKMSLNALLNGITIKTSESK